MDLFDHISVFFLFISSACSPSVSDNTPSSLRTCPSTPVTPCRLSLGDSFPVRRPAAPPGGLAKLLLEKGISAQGPSAVTAPKKPLSLRLLPSTPPKLPLPLPMPLSCALRLPIHLFRQLPSIPSRRALPARRLRAETRPCPATGSPEPWSISSWAVNQTRLPRRQPREASSQARLG